MFTVLRFCFGRRVILDRWTVYPPVVLLEKRQNVACSSGHGDAAGSAGADLSEVVWGSSSDSTWTQLQREDFAAEAEIRPWWGKYFPYLSISPTCPLPPLSPSDEKKISSRSGVAILRRWRIKSCIIWWDTLHVDYFMLAGQLKEPCANIACLSIRN